MTHLSPQQLIDAADGRAASREAAHLESCRACQEQVASLIELLTAAREDPVPDPSPLAWERLASRVGDAVRQERPRASWWFAWGWRWAPLAMVAVLAVTAGIGVGVWKDRAPGSPSGTERPGVRDVPDAAAELDHDALAADDPAWTLVSDLSADVSLEEAESLGAMPPIGGSDRALWQLTAEERRVLAAILEEELAAGASPVPRVPGA